MTALTFQIPKPVSLNNAYGNGRRGRFLTNRASTFKQVVGWNAKQAAMEQGWEYGGGRLRLTLVLHFPNALRRDISNHVKLAEDACGEALGFDDRVIDVLHVERGEVRKPGCAIVTLEELR